MELNHFLITGTVVDVKPLRRSPAGVEQLAFRVKHCSKQRELGKDMLVEFDITVVAIGDLARSKEALVQSSAHLQIEGFIDSAGYHPEQKQRLVIRAQSIERAG